MKGQASTDYVAILLLVAIAAAAAAAVASAAGLAPEVRRQMLRALCVVRGGDCETDRSACVVASERDSETTSLSILILRLSHNRVLMRERRSDGTIAVTLSEGDERGLGISAPGAHLHVPGHDALNLGGEATAAALAARNSGRTWVLTDPRRADALAAVLRDPRRSRDPRSLAPFGPPSTTFNESGLKVKAGVKWKYAGVEISAADVAGTREDGPSGRRTVYIKRSDDASASFSVRRFGAKVGAAPSEEYAVTMDRSGRALDLAVISTAAFNAGATLPRELQAMAERGGVPLRAARKVVREEHLDLTDPDNLALARAFLAQVSHPALQLGAAVDVSRELAQRLDAVGVVNLRAYDADTRHSGVDVGASLGAKLGGSYDHEVEGSRLRGATTRGIDGVWRRRGDCLAAV